MRSKPRKLSKPATRVMSVRWPSRVIAKATRAAVKIERNRNAFIVRAVEQIADAILAA